MPRHATEHLRVGADRDRPGGGATDLPQHVCAFFNGVDEQHRVLRSFIADGFREQEKAFHLIDPARRDEHLGWLEGAGVEVADAMGAGQLEVRSWQEGPLRGERFDQEAWMTSFEEALRSGPASGYVRTRFLAHMEWALVDLPGVEDLIEFESRVNHVIVNDDVVVCAYDLARFGASVVIDALRTHPLVIVGGLLQENPFFVPPDQFLLELRERRSEGGSTNPR